MKYIKLILIPIFFAIILRVLFGATIFNDIYSVMSWTFFLLVPAGIGALFIYFSPINYVDRLSYRIIAPWLPITFVIIITIAIGLEGWACWLMISPLFYLFASIGGTIAGYYKIKSSKNKENLNLSIILILPFIVGPIENSIPRSTKIYTTYTSIVINADANTIWNNVTSVKEIKPKEDHSKLIN